MRQARRPDTKDAGQVPFAGGMLSARDQECFARAKEIAACIHEPLYALVSSHRAILTMDVIYRGQNAVATKKAVTGIVAPLCQTNPSLAAILYFAAEYFHPLKANDREQGDISELVGIFSPLQIITSLSLALIAHDVRRRCDTLWDSQIAPLTEHLHWGRFVGEQFHLTGRVKTAEGVLLAGFQYLSSLLMYAEQPNEYRDYRDAASRKGMLFDLELEVGIFGCNHRHIAALLLQRMGFGVLAALRLVPGASEAYSDDLEQATRWQEIMSIIECLHAQKHLPEEIDPDDWFSERNRYFDCRDLIKKTAQATPPSCEWLFKRHKDLDTDTRKRFNLPDVPQNTGAPLRTPRRLQRQIDAEQQETEHDEPENSSS